MELPAGLSVVKTSRPFPKAKAQPEVVQNADGTTAIYWLGDDFTHNQGSTRRFSAKVTVDACAPETLAVTALAYPVNATDLTAYCAEPLAEPAILRVRYPGVKKGQLGNRASRDRSRARRLQSQVSIPQRPLCLSAWGSDACRQVDWHPLTIVVCRRIRISTLSGIQSATTVRNTVIWAQPW